MQSKEQKATQDANAPSVDAFCARNDISRSAAYEEIRAGRLKAKKFGRRTLILPDAEQEWKTNLPDLVPRKTTKAA